MLKLFTDSLLALVYPQNCHLCDESVEKSDFGIVCENCWQKPRIFSGKEILCGKCGVFLREGSIASPTFCRRCDGHFYDRAAAVGTYQNALAASVLHLKKTPFVSRQLQKLYCAAFENNGFENIDLIIPVPLSAKRLIERGHNQSEILAGILSKKFRLKTDLKSLLRTRHTPMHRAAMDEKARAMTVKEAFAIKRANLLNGKDILLVDDVLTSGATVSACAEEVKRAGAKNVYVLTIARAI